MKIVLFGVTGNVGRRVATEALRRGHEVVGVVRDPEAVQSPDPQVRRFWRAEGSGLDWTFLSPAAEIVPGERTGRYRTTGDQLLTDASGRSLISFEDYAVAVLDELEHPQHVGQRFGVAY
jgi:putative NADH-flavin reductase